MTDHPTDLLGLIRPDNGDYVDTWDVPINGNMTKIDNALQPMYSKTLYVDPDATPVDGKIFNDGPSMVTYFNANTGTNGKWHIVFIKTCGSDEILTFAPGTAQYISISAMVPSTINNSTIPNYSFVFDSPDPYTRVTFSDLNIGSTIEATDANTDHINFYNCCFSGVILDSILTNYHINNCIGSIDFNDEAVTLYVTDCSDLSFVNDTGPAVITYTEQVGDTPTADNSLATKKYVDDNAGAIVFTDLTDVPSSYTSQANKLVTVNAGEDALEFINSAEINTVYVDSGYSADLVGKQYQSFETAWNYIQDNAIADSQWQIIILRCGVYGDGTVTLNWNTLRGFKLNIIGVTDFPPNANYVPPIFVSVFQNNRLRYTLNFTTYPVVGLKVLIKNCIVNSINDNGQCYLSFINSSLIGNSTIVNAIFENSKSDVVISGQTIGIRNSQINTLVSIANSFQFRIESSEVNNINCSTHSGIISFKGTCTLPTTFTAPSATITYLDEVVGADPTTDNSLTTKAYVDDSVNDSNLLYTPADGTKWADADPTTVKQALDRMAALLYTLNSNVPIP